MENSSDEKSDNGRDVHVDAVTFQNDTEVLKTIRDHSHDADEAMKVLAGRDGPFVPIDAATNKRLLKKIDWNIMPLLCLIYGLQFLDKTTLSYASVMGIQKDIKLVGNNYQTLSSIFYVGYIIWEYPTALLLQRLPLAKYSSFCIIMWGLVLCCMATVENYSGAMAVRTFLGVFESAVTPGFALFTSQWYTKQEQGTRSGIWFSFNGFAQIFGGLISYAIAVGVRLHGSAILPWKVLFLVTGLFTVVIGAYFLVVMPDNQLNARWLTQEDRVLAIERIRINQQGVGNKHFKLYQLKEALLDPVTWAFTLGALTFAIPSGGITNFFSQLIVNFGFSAEHSLLYGTPGGAVGIIFFIACGYLGDRYGNRILFGMSGMIVGIIGMVLIVALPTQFSAGRLVGYYLTQATPTPFIALLSLISTNFAGYTKKTTVAAMYLIAYCAGNIIGPQLFRPQDAPQYRPAEITIICCWVVCLLDMLFILYYYRNQNKKKAAFRAQVHYSKLENQEWLDLTDRENPEFIYTL